METKEVILDCDKCKGSFTIEVPKDFYEVICPKCGMIWEEFE